MSAHKLTAALTALLAASLACSLGGTTPTPPGTGSGDAATPTSPAQPASLVFELSDESGDCFSGLTRNAADCAGLDLVGLSIGLPGGLPAFGDESIMTGRLVFVLTLAEDLAQVETFGLCLWMDLDRNPATGKDLSGNWGGIPGIDRGVCVEVPEGRTYFYYYHADWEIGVDRDEPLYDDSLAAAVVAGKQVGLGIHPALLATSDDAAPQGFVLFVGTARSIEALDHFNDQGSLTQAQSIEVPDEVVSGAR